MDQIRSTDLVVRDFLLELSKVGKTTTDEDVMRVRNTFAYAAAEFHDTVNDLLRTLLKKRPIPRVYELNEVDGTN